MKVILSRKGLDSAYGGFPSPILPDGNLLSFPIPYIGDKITYADLKTNIGYSYLEIMKHLKKTINIPTLGKVNLNDKIECHLDPDLVFSCFPRKRGWLPIFGQVGQSQTHLRNQQVNKGDLFLFFGWFRETVWKGNKLRFKKNSPDLHVIFGYLQIGEILFPHQAINVPKWMEYHPHIVNKKRKAKRTNAIYVASKYASWDPKLPGASSLEFNKKLILTKKGKSRSIWELPKFFRKLNITYHSENSWNNDGSFNSAKIGQEFVIEENKEVEKWAISLISNNNSTV